MQLAADYPFLSVFWTMLVFFFWVIWIWLLITVFADVFRRHDLSGWGKAGWLIFVIVLPYLGVFIYFITQGGKMSQRNVKESQAAQAQFDDYVKSVAGGSSSAAAEIERAHKLLTDGAITQAEFDAIKAKALS